MKKITAEQQRFLDNAVLIVAIRLSFDTLARSFPVKPLAELITIHNGQGLTAENRQQQGDYPVYAAGGLIGKHDNQLSDAPFIVIGRKGSAGKTTYAPTGGWVIDTAYYAQPNDVALLSCKFLFYAVSSLDFSRDVISTAIPGINRTSIYKYLIPVPPLEIQLACVEFLDAAQARSLDTLGELPPPLDDQRRIVAQIDALATQIEEARGLKSFTKTNTDRFWKVLSQIARSAKSPVQTLDNMVEFLDGKRIPLSDDVRKTKQGSYPYYGASGIIDFIDDYIFDEELLLLSEDGANLLYRSTPIAFVASGKYWVNNHAHVLRPLPKIAYIHFLKYALSDFDVSIYNFASAQPKLNQSNARKIAFPLPSLDEQQEIVAHLDALQAQLDALRSLQRESAAELDALLPSILDRAFRGEL